MALKEQLMTDLKDAMKNKNVTKKDTIQIVRAGILQIEKDEQKELTDDEIIQVIVKEVKKKNDVLPDYEKSGREDLLEEVNKQISFLKSYLPEQLTEEEVAIIVDECISEVGATSMKDMGKVMGKISSKVSGRADNKLVSELVKARLG